MRRLPRKEQNPLSSKYLLHSLRSGLQPGIGSAEEKKGQIERGGVWGKSDS